MVHSNHGTAAEEESYAEELERWTAEGGSPIAAGALYSEDVNQAAAESSDPEEEPVDE